MKPSVSKGRAPTVVPASILNFPFEQHCGSTADSPFRSQVYKAVRSYQMLESRTAYPNYWRAIHRIQIIFALDYWLGYFYFLLSKASRGVGIQGNSTYPHRQEDNATLTRIGATPIPVTNAEFALTIVNSLIGVITFTTLVGLVRNIILNKNRLEFERLLDDAKNFMRHHKVPEDMKRRVLRFYDYAWSRGKIQVGDNTLLRQLPDTLNAELALHIYLSVLKKVPIFQECQPEFLHDLVLKMESHIFSPGDCICQKGEEAREMFIIADGILQVISETGHVLSTMKTGDFFGEIGISNLDGLNKRVADVRSVGYSELFSISRKDVLEALKHYPEAQEILQTFGRKWRQEAKNMAKKCAKNDISPDKPRDHRASKRIVHKLRTDVKIIDKTIAKEEREKNLLIPTASKPVSSSETISPSSIKSSLSPLEKESSSPGKLQSPTTKKSKKRGSIKEQEYVGEILFGIKQKIHHLHEMHEKFQESLENEMRKRDEIISQQQTRLQELDRIMELRNNETSGFEKGFMRGTSLNTVFTSSRQEIKASDKNFQTKIDIFQAEALSDELSEGTYLREHAEKMKQSKSLDDQNYQESIELQDSTWSISQHMTSENRPLLSREQSGHCTNPSSQQHQHRTFSLGSFFGCSRGMPKPNSNDIVLDIDSDCNCRESTSTSLDSDFKPAPQTPFLEEFAETNTKKGRAGQLGSDWELMMLAEELEKRERDEGISHRYPYRPRDLEERGTSLNTVFTSSRQEIKASDKNFQTKIDIFQAEALSDELSEGTYLREHAEKMKQSKSLDDQNYQESIELQDSTWSISQHMTSENRPLLSREQSGHCTNPSSQQHQHRTFSLGSFFGCSRGMPKPNSNDIVLDIDSDCNCRESTSTSLDSDFKPAPQTPFLEEFAETNTKKGRAGQLGSDWELMMLAEELEKRERDEGISHRYPYRPRDLEERGTSLNTVFTSSRQEIKASDKNFQTKIDIFQAEALSDELSEGTYLREHAEKMKQSKSLDDQNYQESIELQDSTWSISQHMTSENRPLLSREQSGHCTNPSSQQHQHRTFSLGSFFGCSRGMPKPNSNDIVLDIDSDCNCRESTSTSLDSDFKPAPQTPFLEEFAETNTKKGRAGQLGSDWELMMLAEELEKRERDEGISHRYPYRPRDLEEMRPDSSEPQPGNDN